VRRNWIAVASGEHVQRGVAQGFMQVCHGKATPLRRVHPGDRVVYYSPTHRFQGKDPLRAFTAIGIVGDGEAYQVDLGEGFYPFRRSVSWRAFQVTPIAGLRERLEFCGDGPNWAGKFRFGLFTISDSDFGIIETAMCVLPT